MSYKVTSALAIVPNADGESSDGYFYENAVIPDGFNDERCKQLVKDGMLEKVKAEKAPDSEPSPDSVEGIVKAVGDDKEKAKTALAEEQAKDKPRSTLVEKLQAVIDA